MSLHVELIPLFIEDEGMHIEKEYFTENIRDISFERENRPTSGNIDVIPTKIRNKRLLREALIQTYNEYTSLFDKENAFVVFDKTHDNTYSVIFDGTWSNNEKNTISNIVISKYDKIVQKITYEKVLKKIKDEGYSLVKENKTDQDSIVLTVKV